MTTTLVFEPFRAPDDSSCQKLESRRTDELRAQSIGSAAGTTLDIARHRSE